MNDNKNCYEYCTPHAVQVSFLTGLFPRLLFCRFEVKVRRGRPLDRAHLVEVLDGESALLLAGAGSGAVGLDTELRLRLHVRLGLLDLVVVDRHDEVVIVVVRIVVVLVLLLCFVLAVSIAFSNSIALFTRWSGIFIALKWIQLAKICSFRNARI